MNNTTKNLSLFVVLALAGGFAQAEGGSDEPMLALARNAGCLVCHAVESGTKGPGGLSPVGPAWTDVAERYRDDKGAQARLVGEVMAGTSVYDRHWKDKASGVAMPPNAVAIGEADAKRLVAWILGLTKK